MMKPRWGRAVGALAATAAAAWIMPAPGALAQDRYGVGDKVEEFSLTERSTGLPVRLSDFAGSIVFLEWFAHWCPFCVAAAPQVHAGIVEHYRERGGNPAGIPVVHVAINLQPDTTARDRTATTTFVERYGFDPVLQDSDRGLARRFAASGQPIFAIINGVAGSPNARQWELLYSRLGYGSTTSPIEEFRQAIDRVQAPRAALPTVAIGLCAETRMPKLMFSEAVTEGVMLESSSDLLEWAPGPVLPPGAQTWELAVGDEGVRFHRLRRVP